MAEPELRKCLSATESYWRVGSGAISPLDLIGRPVNLLSGYAA